MIKIAKTIGRLIAVLVNTGIIEREQAVMKDVVYQGEEIPQL